MRGNTRVVLNTVATYGRSLIAVALGLFSTRWVLGALGQSDLGLYGVVGSIIVFITFLNSSLSGSEARFFAYSLGYSKTLSPDQASEDLCRWFNMSLLIHILIPMLLVAIGYPLGIYAIKNWLVIPADRLDACIWVFRFAVLSAFCSMISVPFSAMFQAYQYITELSLLSLADTVIRFFCAYFLLKVEGDRLVAYSFYMMAIAVLNMAVIFCWAKMRFKVCKLRLQYLLDASRMREFFAFAGAKMFGSLCVILRSQGGCLLINRYFSPVVNAAYSISVQVSGQTETLSQALIGALQPVLAQKAGEMDLGGLRQYAISTCRIATLLVMIFVVPLSLEINFVLNLWLVNPPPYTLDFCLVMLWTVVINKMSIGYMLAANAYGKKIIIYDLILGLTLLSALPLTYFLFACGFSPLAMGFALMVTSAIYAFGRIVFCRWMLNMSIFEWVISVALPLLLTLIISFGIATIPFILLSAGFVRVILVGICSLLATLCGGWWIVFSNVERTASKSFCQRMLQKLRGAR